MKQVVIASAVRTPMGSFNGTLAKLSPAKLGEIVIREALERAKVSPELVDEVYMGCVLQSGQGQGVARQASINAGLPVETPATTINMICGSGLKSVSLAVQSVLLGDNDIVVAGGTECMSSWHMQCPWLDGVIEWVMVKLLILWLMMH